MISRGETTDQCLGSMRINHLPNQQLFEVTFFEVFLQNFEIFENYLNLFLGTQELNGQLRIIPTATETNDCFKVFGQVYKTIPFTSFHFFQGQVDIVFEFVR